MELLKMVFDPIFYNFLFSLVGYGLTYRMIPKFRDISLKANVYGIDLGKANDEKIPEAMGVICGAVFLTVMSFFIPFSFIQYWPANTPEQFPHHQFMELVVALFSICLMLFLGLVDDVFNLPWLCKLLFPAVASVPLLMVYYVTYNGTTVIIPKPFSLLFGNDVWLGLFYYVYMAMLTVFCTNAINIFSGINGLEVGQSAVIGTSIVIFNSIELIIGECPKAHLFSLYFMIPFLFTTFALLCYNWYPASVFVGDTFCYFAGMTFAVVGILGHFSKTMLLFFIPQVINFLFSCPQLFHFLPCPRHRLPRYNKEKDLMEPSIMIFKPKDLSSLGHFCLTVAKTFKLVNYLEIHKDDDIFAECTNFTVINYLLKVAGPTHEKWLTLYLLAIQMLCTVVAFLIRYELSKVFYDS